MRAAGRCAVPATFLLLAGCYPRPVDPVAVAPPAPFERLPYVQDVSDTAASILWKSEGPAGADTVFFRPSASSGDAPGDALDGSGGWRAVPADSVARGVRRARLRGLSPSGEYEYFVSAGGVRPDTARFRAAPVPGSRDTVRVLLFGDSGWGSDGQLALARRMARHSWDLAIHVGDVAYEDGTERDLTLRHFLVYQDVLAGVPFFPAVGNHDLHVDDGRAYDLAFEWPAPLPGIRWYAFRWGPALFIALDTSSPTADVEGLRAGTGRQYEWLESTLAAAAEDGTIAWTIVFLHHPLISHGVGLSGHGSDRALLRHLGPLFERTGVDVVAAGHDHHYERTYPVRDGRRVRPGCGYTHVLQGAGGASMHARAVREGSLSAVRSRRYSFTELRITPDRILGRTFADDGSVIDEFQVVPFAGEGDPECGS